MRAKKTCVFIVCMTVLCIAFLTGLFRDPLNGAQTDVFFGRCTGYMQDYFNVAKYSASRNPYYYEEADPLPAEHAYPPLAYLIAYFHSRCADYVNLTAIKAWETPTGQVTSSVFMFLEAFLLILFVYDANKSNKAVKGIVTMLFVFSGIFLFSFERGNIIFLAAFCTSFFLINYDNENKYVRELSFIALAIAAGLKAYPALLGVLLLFDRQYKSALRLIIYGILAFFVPFLFFKGGFHNLPIMLRNLQLNSAEYSERIFPRFNFRFWAAQINSLELRQWIYRIYSILDAVLCVLAVGLAAFQPIRWKRYMLLLLVLVILPLNSAEYAGLYLLIGVVLFLNEENAGKLDWVYLALMLAFLNPFQLIKSGINITQYMMNISVSLLFCILLLDSAVSMIKSRKRIQQSQGKRGIEQCG